MKKQSVQKPVIWLWHASKGIRFEVLLLLLAEVLSGVSGVALAWMLRDMIDSAVAQNWRSFASYALLFVGVIVVQLVLRMLDRWFKEHASSTLENRLKQRLFSVLMERDYAAVTAMHSEEWMNRLVSDTQIAANGVAQSIWSLAALAGAAFGPVYITVIGQCMGAEDVEAAEYYFKKLTKITLVFSIAWNGIVFLVTPGKFLMLST